MTPGAVSQQIRLLEDRLGVALFTRERQGLRLTADGAAAHPAAAGVLADRGGGGHAGAGAVAADRDGEHDGVVRGVVAGARLARFRARHPRIELRVEASSSVVDLRRDRVDVALRHGSGVIPVCMRCG